MARHIDSLLMLKGMNNCTPKDNPDIQTPLGPDIYGDPCK